MENFIIAIFVVISLFVLVIYANIHKISFFYKYDLWADEAIFVLPFFRFAGKLYLADKDIERIIRDNIGMVIPDEIVDEIIYLPVEISTGLFRKAKMIFVPNVICEVVGIDNDIISYSYDAPHYWRCSHGYNPLCRKDVCNIYTFDIENGKFCQKHILSLKLDEKFVLSTGDRFWFKNDKEKISIEKIIPSEPRVCKWTREDIKGPDDFDD